MRADRWVGVTSTGDIHLLYWALELGETLLGMDQVGPHVMIGGIQLTMAIGGTVIAIANDMVVWYFP